MARGERLRRTLLAVFDGSARFPDRTRDLWRLQPVALQQVVLGPVVIRKSVGQGEPQELRYGRVEPVSEMIGDGTAQAAGSDVLLDGDDQPAAPGQLEHPMTV